ncbi:hypothetical protein CONPUDRAFT_164354 [Coniophora puteana RWD-64-598 SS2]|uniref:F-box domain-containing protein n=1 Tax=Coniophora puteana (strain RWD-64-598) TaxID=741705 RepID=A0A5M3MWA1_CONPW|nr:uncharacterized protein CONPUDRAFT_164354 [Coniophora puteana RWD-64-598 SS2]EIW83396.1 hypothetical protein CONPUDRAFT_164354 [Coniophora puteana RWD-64-598 SS2]
MSDDGMPSDSTSAHSESKGGASWADLALEIWLEIFRFATHLPDAKTISQPNPFARKQPLGSVLNLSNPLTSMRTKTSIVCVSRAWRLVATEILYEDLEIRSLHHAQKLLKCLIESDRAAPAYPRPTDGLHQSNGLCAKHLFVSPTLRDRMPYLKCIFDIMQQCPNVRFLNIVWDQSLPPAFLDSLARLYGRSLRGLHIGADDDLDRSLRSRVRHPVHHVQLEYQQQNVPEKVLTPLYVARFTNLSVLDVRKVLWVEMDGNPTEEISMPSLHELILSNDSDSLTFASRLTLPSLRRVHMSLRFDISYDDTHLTCLTQFLEKHGRNITELDIKPLIACRRPPSPTARIAQYLEHCPRLEQIVYSAHDERIETLSTPHHALRRIGIRDIDWRELSHNPRSVVSAGVKALLRSFDRDLTPNLDVVRTLDFMVETSISLSSVNTLMTWTEYFEKKGIDLEDGEGVVWLYEPSET